MTQDPTTDNIPLDLTIDKLILEQWSSIIQLFLLQQASLIDLAKNPIVGPIGITETTTLTFKPLAEKTFEEKKKKRVLASLKALKATIANAFDQQPAFLGEDFENDLVHWMDNRTRR